MTPERLRDLLARVRAGEVAIETAVEELRRMPFDRLGEIATLDHHRELRSGVPEVVYGESKTAQQIAAVMRRMAESSGGRALATRVAEEKANHVLASLPGARYVAAAQAVVLGGTAATADAREVAVVSAGTSDRPVAEEAAVTLEFLGLQARRFVDVGIAGLPRVVSVAEELRASDVVIAVAGMEGALPSVVASLVDRPVIAVPTSVGYGVGLGGFVAMLTMLASCSPGVTVVNIDNGFGAAVAAARMVRRRR
jgi:NCAIR mutase (PurE)-related protein